MGGRAGGGARGGARGGKAAGGGARGGVDYLAQKGITDKDVLRVLKSSRRKLGLDPAYNAKQEAKAIQVDTAFNTVYEMLKSGRLSPASRRK